MWKCLVFIIMTSKLSILVVASDNNYANIPTVTTTRFSNSSAQEGTCKPQQTKCTCICEVIPDEPPSTTTVSTLPSSKSSASTTTDCTTSTEATTSTQLDLCSQYESLCPKMDDDHPIYIPHPNCSAFCKCGNGRIFYRSCSVGLHFNPVEKVCDHPRNAKCTGLPPLPSDSCKALSMYCPIPDGDHPLYIPLSNCSAFCKCTNGEAIYHPCPDGLHFNAKKNVCDWPANAACDREN
ncbi:unnamed protein product [Ceutorhynchus assimilis]|uniref:Chitin-binding type-2 domain-containing protein n=1 Tax=Ceutorhynchus assimilis TaxID=467358 RepID=A0A9N9QJP1_9CUCU|nr:unnamed protein product [Ceutorhynchus assimilis]